MNPISIGREVVSACALMASYPFDFLTILQARIARGLPTSRDPIILVHGNGGDRTNMLAMSLLLRISGFGNIGFFTYSARQSVEDSAGQLAEMAAQIDGGEGVHLIGHSLGGMIARMAAARTDHRRTRSLVTLGSPWSATQRSPHEVAIFGNHDPIVAPPGGRTFPDGMFKRLIVLRNTGHLALLYHEDAICIALRELTANRTPSP